MGTVDSSLRSHRRARLPHLHIFIVGQAEPRGDYNQAVLVNYQR